MVRVLVVDDSAFMRKALTKMLQSDSRIRVVGTARDGLDALDKIEKLDPDLVTLDVEMPRMSGLEALEQIMARFPRPVVMVSSLTEEGAEVTLRALDMGAVDFIPKKIDTSVLDVVRIEKALCDKVCTLARKAPHRLHRKQAPVAQPAPPRSFPERAGPERLPSREAPRVRPPRPSGRARYVAIGASTGGPPALQRVFSNLPEDFSTPLVVVQHMPKSFTGAFARRLSRAGPLEVKEAETGDRLEPGRGFVAPGGAHMVVDRDGGGLVLRITDDPADSLYRPSVDVTFRSFAEVVGGDVLAVVLTGMGADGREGMRVLKDRGAPSIAQNERTCVVYGMPKAVVEAGLADAVLPIDAIGKAVGEAVG